MVVVRAARRGEGHQAGVKVGRKARLLGSTGESGGF